MEPATADRGPEALRAAARPSSPPRDDLRRHRGPPHPLPVRHEGPARARARLRQRRARVRGRHRAQELRPVPRRARLRRLAARLPREPGPRRPATRSSPSTTSRCATGRPRSTRSGSETGADSVQAMGHCVGGLSLFMAIGGGLEGLRSATFSALAGHPIPTPGNRVRAGVRLATMFKTLGIKGLNTDYDPDYAARPRGRARDARAALPPRLRQPGRPAHLLRLRRRLRLREHQRGRR